MTKIPADGQTVQAPDGKAGHKLAPAARRALAEAAARRAAAPETEPATKETGGRGGLEPVRYGDWEVRGLASDF
jgi:hypothetical protein